MTEENVNLYEKLDNEFHETCEHIAQILDEYECFRKDDIFDANTYTLRTNDVWYEGRDENKYFICGAFDRKYLTMTDGQIRKSAKKKNDVYLVEYQKYLELKHKFENE